MDSIKVYRDQARKHALRPLGVSSRGVRGFAREVQMTGLEAEILQLPFYGGDVQALQDATTGAPFFMVGISAVGTDALG